MATTYMPVEERIDRLEALLNEAWEALAHMAEQVDGLSHNLGRLGECVERLSHAVESLVGLFGQGYGHLQELHEQTVKELAALLEITRRFDERLQKEHERFLLDLGRVEELGRERHEQALREIAETRELDRERHEQVVKELAGLREITRRFDERLQKEHERFLLDLGRVEELGRERHEQALREIAEARELDRQRHEQAMEKLSRLEERGKQLHAEVARMTKQWGDIANKMGTLAEDIVAPSIPSIVREVLGCEEEQIERFAVRLKCRHPHDRGRQREYDVIAVCGEHVLINETKSSINTKDVDDFVTAMRQAREFLSEYADRRFIGAIASLYVDESIVRYAQRQGLLVLGLGDEMMEVLNDPGFQPAEF